MNKPLPFYEARKKFITLLDKDYKERTFSIVFEDILLDKKIKKSYTTIKAAGDDIREFILDNNYRAEFGYNAIIIKSSKKIIHRIWFPTQMKDIIMLRLNCLSK